MKHLGVLLFPPGWDATPSQGYPQQYVAGTHLSTWVKKESHASTKNSRNIASLLHAFNVIAWLEVFILLNKNALKRVKSSLLGGEEASFSKEI